MHGRWKANQPKDRRRPFLMVRETNLTQFKRYWILLKFPIRGFKV
jgi:hypothetical protein